MFFRSHMTDISCVIYFKMLKKKLQNVFDDKKQLYDLHLRKNI